MRIFSLFNCQRPEDFVEPFGLEVKKGSLFFYLSNKNESHYSVLYYDDEENSVYPIYAPKKALSRIKTSDVDKEKRILFEQWKQDAAKGIFRSNEVVIDNRNRKFSDPEERRKYVLNMLKNHGIEIEGIPGVDTGFDK